MALFSKYTRALTFENCVTPTQELGDGRERELVLGQGRGGQGGGQGRAGGRSGGMGGGRGAAGATPPAQQELLGESVDIGAQEEEDEEEESSVGSGGGAHEGGGGEEEEEQGEEEGEEEDEERESSSYLPEGHGPGQAWGRQGWGSKGEGSESREDVAGEGGEEGDGGASAVFVPVYVICAHEQAVL